MAPPAAPSPAPVLSTRPDNPVTELCWVLIGLTFILSIGQSLIEQPDTTFVQRASHQLPLRRVHILDVYVIVCQACAPLFCARYLEDAQISVTLNSLTAIVLM